VDESEIIDRARTEPDAFACLYERTATEVYRFAFSLTRDHARAEDVTAETYRRALARIPAYEDRGTPFVAWLFTIARNFVRDGARRGARETPLLDHDTPTHDWPGEGVVRGERQLAVQAALRRLPPVQRRVMVLRYGHERSCRDIGDELGKSEAAIKQLSYRAARRLRQLLEEDGYEHDA
jgi:RNA polymerase sigma-70 factor (ECF subfamily)